ncbi:MAG TPA: CxxxxCH/CxxCH domain-containing protein [bacterium]
MGRGPCGPCHVPHVAGGARLWSRSLADEAGFYNQTSDPNYVPGASLQCYDCHDDGVSVADRDPPAETWSINKAPQDIALGGTLGGVPLIGYYEEADGTLPTGASAVPPSPPTDGSPTGGHYWKTEPSDSPDRRKRGDKIACALCHDPHGKVTGTNMAFFRTVSGDGTAVTLVDGAKSSKNTRSGADMGTSAGNGRSMCESCHGNSNQGAQQTFYSVQVPKPTDGVPEHVYSSSDAATACTDCHPHNRPAGCDQCHAYPPLVATPFDRLNNPQGQSYEGGAGAHRRHLDALGADIFKCEVCHGPNPGRTTTTWHAWDDAANRGATVVAQQNVDIIGQTAYWGAGSGYAGAGSSIAVPSGYAFTAKGGKDGAVGGRCYNLTCHGNPPQNTGSAFLNWDDDMVDDATGPTKGDFVGDGAAICKWCHDGTPARIGTGPYAPNVLGDNNGASGTWDTGTWGADVNGHGLAAGNYEKDLVGEATRTGLPAANKGCAVCHDATYSTNALPAPNTPTKTHYGGTSKRLRDTVNGQPGIADDADKTCLACHQVVSGPDVASPDGRVVAHGNSDGDGYRPPKEPDQFVRNCRQCHEPHGANWNGVNPNPRNLHMIGKWVDVNGNGLPDGGAMGPEAARVDSDATDSTTNIDTNDLAVITKSSGNPSSVFPDPRADDSWDDGNNDGLSPPDSLCVVCHVSLSQPHSMRSTSVPQGTGHLVVGTECRICHKHGTLDTHPNKAPDAFGPLSCFACHGVAPLDTPPSGAFAGQYWPSGASSKVPDYDYANDQPGAHLNHIEAIGQQVFGETAAQLVTNTALSSYEKQLVVCSFCHFDPGGASGADPNPHFNNTNLDNSPTGRVDVKQGTGGGRDFFKFTTGPGPFGHANYSADPSGGGYSFAGANDGTCANLVCHNQTRTPSSWNSNPLPWYDAGNNWQGNATCSNINCHAAGTYTNAHATHVNGTNVPAGKSYQCYECHANNTGAPGHGNGKIDMVWTNAASLEAKRGDGNGAYAKGTAFAYKDGTYNATCSLLYCHGGDNPGPPPGGWDGGNVTPAWDNSAGVYCGSCHDANGSDAVNPGGLDVFATGNHPVHLNDTWGPHFAQPPGTPQTSCLGTATTGCHTDYQRTTATHVDGSAEFRNIAASPAFSLLGTQAVTTPTAAETDRCSYCHSTLEVTANVAGPAVLTGAGAALAKINWVDQAFKLPCVTCHNPALTGATTYPNGTGLKAPDLLGDDLNYGAEVRGHNRSAADGAYALATNPAAALLCTECHDASAPHINGSNDTGLRPGNRIAIIVNGQSPGTVREVCRACHATAKTTPPSAQVERNRAVNSHGNNNHSFIEPGAFALQCEQCHEPHGMTYNGAGYNIQMISPNIVVNTPSDPGTDTVASGVRFEALTGPFSFSDGVAPEGTALCVVCHRNSNNPGYSMTYTNAANGSHDDWNMAYTNDERGTNCSTCHTHNQDYPRNTTNIDTIDGFMPVDCNACHTYPGKDNLGALPTYREQSAPATHRLSASHDQHVGVPNGETAPVPNYGAIFNCSFCHYQSSHNDRELNAGDAWSGVTQAMVQVRFNGTWNPAATNPADRTQDSPSYDEGAQTCSNLYCHGDDTGRFPAADQGTNTTPAWGNAATANCGTCHRYTAAAPPGAQAHAKHAGNGAGYAIGCAVCHYGTTQDGTTIQSVALHVSRSSEIFFNGAIDPRVHVNSSYDGDTTTGTGFGACAATYCHSNGADRTAPYDSAPGGSAAPAVQLAWDQTGGGCWNCHGNGTDDPAPPYPNNGISPNGTPKANKHPIHTGTGDPAATPNTNGYGCAVCHWLTVHDNTSVVAIANHVNRTYDVAPSGAASTLWQFAPAAGSCNSINCHGGASGVSWGLAGPIACGDCHAQVAGARAASDVNEFHWDGSSQSKISNAVGGEWETRGHGAKSVACAGCHASTVGHDTTANLSGANPFRLAANGGTGPGSFTCSNTGIGCHSARPVSLVKDHTGAEMSASGYTPQVDSWSFTPKCADCHDPHGDDANLHMVSRELVEGSGPNWVPAVWPPEKSNLVFTDDSTGADDTGNSYANLSSPQTSLCQQCHRQNDPDFTSFKHGFAGISTATHPTQGGNPGDCSYCHRHRSAFAPTGCEGCHNGDGDWDGTWTGVGYDPDGTGPKAAAPNVMGDGVKPDGDGMDPKPYDDGLYGFNVNGHGANGTARNTPVDSVGQPMLSMNAECTDCHNIAIPTGTHLDGTLNSVELKQNKNVNTAHLNATYIGTSTPDWNVQLTLDNGCAYQCHSSKGRHRHNQDDVIPAPGVVRFGKQGSVLNGQGVVFPIDVHLSTNAPDWPADGVTNFDYAVCISCHNPHGTSTVDGSYPNNSMLRDERSETLCKRCHN